MIIQTLLLCLTLAHAQTAAQNSVGRISKIEGPSGQNMVTLQNLSGRTSANVGSALHAGDHVLTGPDQSVELSLSDDSQMIVGPSSDFSINEVLAADGHTSLGLVSGMLHAVVNKIYSAESPLTVETPNAAMGVRGTEFIAEHDGAGGESQIHTLEGSVAFGHSRADLRNPGNTTMLSAGMMSGLGRGMTRPRPPQHFETQRLFERLSRKSPRFAQHVQARRAVVDQIRKMQHQQPQTRVPSPQQQNHQNAMSNGGVPPEAKRAEAKREENGDSEAPHKAPVGKKRARPNRRHNH